MAAELVFNKVATLEQLAGLDDLQLQQVFFRARDKAGRLLIDGLPPGENPADRELGKFVKHKVSWEVTYKSTKRAQSARWKGKVVNGRVFAGFTEADIERMWQEWLDRNPKLAAFYRRQVASDRRPRHGRGEPRVRSLRPGERTSASDRGVIGR